MDVKKVFVRFFIPSFVVTLYCMFKFRCKVSPRAEVELSQNLSIGSSSMISSFVKIKAADGPVKIGCRVDVAIGCFITGSAGGLIIGDDCLIGPHCTLLSGSYNINELEKPFREQGQSSKGTRIGNNVMIGAGVVINDGCDIGDGVVIGANSVVSGQIPPNSIVRGDPAKVIFTRR